MLFIHPLCTSALSYKVYFCFWKFLKMTFLNRYGFLRYRWDCFAKQKDMEWLFSYRHGQILLCWLFPSHSQSPLTKPTGNVYYTKVGSVFQRNRLIYILNRVLRILISINPIWPKLWKDVVTQGGPLWLPLFFQLWGYQKPKNEPLHIFDTKNNLNSHFGQF